MPRRNNVKGFWRYDDFANYVRGYLDLERASRSSMYGLQSEVEAMKSLFPTRKEPIPGNPGRFTYGSNYFSIEHGDPIIKKDFEDYFLGRREFTREESLYDSSGRDLADFFEWTMRHLLVEGRSFHSINWRPTTINGHTYVLPSPFVALDPATVWQGFFKKYVQKYSWITYLSQKKHIDYDMQKPPRKYYFDKDEVLIYRYPPSGDSPTKRALPLVPLLKQFWDVSLNQLRAGNEPENRDWRLERARFKNVAEERRKNALVQARIRTYFGYLLPTDTKVTNYYDVYTVTKYKTHCNDLRDYLVDGFNKQVFENLALKNKLAEAPILKFSGFLTNEQINQAFNDFASRTTGIDKFIADVVKAD